MTVLTTVYDCAYSRLNCAYNHLWLCLLPFLTVLTTVSDYAYNNLWMCLQPLMTVLTTVYDCAEALLWLCLCDCAYNHFWLCLGFFMTVLTTVDDCAYNRFWLCLQPFLTVLTTVYDCAYNSPPDWLQYCTSILLHKNILVFVFIYYSKCFTYTSRSTQCLYLLRSLIILEARHIA
jgi:hypothetical protein